MIQSIRASRIRSLLLLSVASLVLMSPPPAAQAAITYHLSTQGHGKSHNGYGHKQIRKYFRHGKKHHAYRHNQFRNGKKYRKYGHNQLGNGTNHQSYQHGKKLFIDSHGRVKKSFGHGASNFGHRRPKHHRTYRRAYRSDFRKHGRSPTYTLQRPHYTHKSTVHRRHGYGG